MMDYQIQPCHMEAQVARDFLQMEDLLVGGLCLVAWVAALGDVGLQIIPVGLHMTVTANCRLLAELRETMEEQFQE
jgi:hypothetical protein